MKTLPLLQGTGRTSWFQTSQNVKLKCSAEPQVGFPTRETAKGWSESSREEKTTARQGENSWSQASLTSLSLALIDLCEEQSFARLPSVLCTLSGWFECLCLLWVWDLRGTRLAWDLTAFLLFLSFPAVNIPGLEQNWLFCNSWVAQSRTGFAGRSELSVFSLN